MQNYNLLYVPGLRKEGIKNHPLDSIAEAVSIVTKVFKRNNISINLRLLDLEDILSQLKYELNQMFPDEEGLPEVLISPINWNEFQRLAGISCEKGAWHFNGEKLEDMTLSDFPFVPDYERYKFIPKIKNIETLRECLKDKSAFHIENFCLSSGIAKPIVPLEEKREKYVAAIKSYLIDLNPSFEYDDLNAEELEKILISNYIVSFLLGKEIFQYPMGPYDQFLLDTKRKMNNPMRLSALYCNSIQDTEERKKIFFRVIDSIDRCFKVCPDGNLIRVELPKDYSFFGGYQIDSKKYREKIKDLLYKNIGMRQMFLFDRLSAAYPIERDSKILFEEGNNNIYTFLRFTLSSFFSISFYPEIYDKPLSMAVLLLHEIAHNDAGTSDNGDFDRGDIEDRLMTAPVDFHMPFSLRRMTPKSIREAYGIKD